MKTLIIIPTYNEAGNIDSLIKEIFRLELGVAILVVDDNSPDGTAEKVAELQTTYPNLFLLQRQYKDGLGRAYLAGFAWAKARGYEAVVQMDADWSHSPKHLPAMLAALADHDFVIGSRYVKGGGITNWPWLRKFVSRGGSLYARTVLGLPIKDLTGGFNAWTKPVLEKFNEQSIKSNGYCFQIELKAKAVRAGHTWQEVPIIFEERRNGQSKLKGKIVWEAVWRVWQLKFKLSRWQPLAALAAILALTAVLYWPSLHNHFLNWDDAMQITGNPDIQTLSLANISRIFSSFYVAMYQPLASLVFMLEYKFFGLNSFPFHLISLLLHLINIVLVWWLFKKLKLPDWLALGAAAIFALHPLNVEAVAWISATGTLLFSLWLLAAVIAYLNYLENNQRRWLWFSFAFFILSILSKSAGIVFPLIIILCHWFKEKPWKKLWLRLAPFLIISGLFGWVTLAGRQINEHLLDLSQFYNLGEKIILVCYSLSFYVVKFFWPLGLTPFYPYPAKNPYLPWYYYAAGAAVAGLATVLIYLATKKKLSRLAIFGWAWFIINLFLVLKIIPVGDQITADRYAYLAMLGLLLLLGLVAKKIIQAKPQLKVVLTGAGLLVIVALSYLTLKQTAIWHDSLNFFNVVINGAPREGGLYDLRAVAKRQAGDITGALSDLNQAIALDPSDDLIHNDRALFLAEALKKYDEALKELDLVIALRPSFHLFYYNRGTVKVRKRDLNGALADFSRAIELEPHAQYYYNRGNVYFELKQYDNALTDYQQTLKINPRFDLAYFNMGLIWLNLKQTQLACDNLAQAAALGLPQAINLSKQACAPK
jgi:glycosyltransferase involved in cell wall biosynthesis/Tfp pilus assembly protein PilF